MPTTNARQIHSRSNEWSLSVRHACICVMYIVKKIRTSTDILWQVFHISMEPYTFESVNRRNKARAHIAMCARDSSRRFTDSNVYGTGSVQYGKLATNISGYTDFFEV